jgi:hypothetical protein
MFVPNGTVGLAQGVCDSDTRHELVGACPAELGSTPQNEVQNKIVCHTSRRFSGKSAHNSPGPRSILCTAGPIVTASRVRRESRGPTAPYRGLPFLRIPVLTVEIIRDSQSNNPRFGYNRWPNFNDDTHDNPDYT